MTATQVGKWKTLWELCETEGSCRDRWSHSKRFVTPFKWHILYTHLFIAVGISKKLQGPLPGTPEETCPRHFGSGLLKAPVLLLTHQQALKRLWRDLSHLEFNPLWILALLVESIVPEKTTIWLDPISNFHPLFLRASLPPRSGMEGWWSKSPHMKWDDPSIWHFQ